MVDPAELNALRAAWSAAGPLSGAHHAYERGWIDAKEWKAVQAKYESAAVAYREALADARRDPEAFGAWVESLYTPEDTPTVRRRKRDMKHSLWWDWCSQAQQGFEPRVLVRAEAPDDAVESLVEAAFGRPQEARLVTALRERPGTLSLVAEIDGQLVGHALFSRVSIEGDPHRRASALAPLAVAEAHRGQGVGSALTHAGQDLLFEDRCNICFVLGDPAYYEGLGFIPAAPRWQCKWPGTEATFQVSFKSWVGVRKLSGGRVTYDSAFDALG